MVPKLMISAAAQIGGSGNSSMASETITIARADLTAEVSAPSLSP